MSFWLVCELRGSEEMTKREIYHLAHQHFKSYLRFCKICNSLDVYQTAFEFSYLFIPTKSPYFHHLFCICNFQNTTFAGMADPEGQGGGGTYLPIFCHLNQRG